MSARTRSVSAVIRSVSAPPVLRIDVVGPDPALSSSSRGRQARGSAAGPQALPPGPAAGRGGCGGLAVARGKGSVGDAGDDGGVEWPCGRRSARTVAAARAVGATSARRHRRHLSGAWAVFATVRILSGTWNRAGQPIAQPPVCRWGGLSRQRRRRKIRPRTGGGALRP